MSGNNLRTSSSSPDAGWAWRGALLLLVAATFGHAVGFDFSGWDDDAVLRRNPRMVEPTLATLRFYWLNAEYDLWVPLTQTVWWAIAHVAGTETPPGGGRPELRPAAFHLASITLHAAAAVAAFELLRRLPGVNGLRAAVGAGVFAVHPVQAESVAWAAGMKDVLAGGLSLAALAAYAAAAQSPGRGRAAKAYALATACFVGAMLAKPSAVVVPAMAAAIDVLLLRPAGPRSWRPAVLRVIPWLLLAIPAAYVAKRVQPGHQGDYVGLAHRSLIAADALAFYLWKLVWPTRLCFDYGRTPQVTLALGWHGAMAIVPAFALIAGAAWRRWRGLAVGLLLLAVGVLPVLGFVPFDFQIYSTVGDHYLYLAMIGPAVAVATLPRLTRRAGLIVSLSALAVLAVAAHRQAWTWETLESMSRQALRVNPASWASHNNLAAAWTDAGRLDEAEAAARRAVEMKPEADVARRTLSGVFVRRGDAAAMAGDAAGAVGHYERAAEIDPSNSIALTNLAATLAEQGQLDRAIALYEEALRLSPNLEAAKIGVELARRLRAERPATLPAAPTSRPAGGS